MLNTGFIPGSRGSWLLDMFAVSLLGVLLLQILSLYFVKYRKNYSMHRLLQIGVVSLLVILIILFEIEVRIFGWEQRAFESPYFYTILKPFLVLHIFIALCFIVQTALTFRSAIKGMPSPPRPTSLTHIHRRNGYISIVLMLLTISSGWLFYYLAFMA